ncbi:MAG: antibiotic biosynthesis monooxygenase [Leptospiraceae bacterium]|nr:antibiotic biosynthesis monooxygenase [Leptospiraceae bacterium]
MEENNFVLYATFQPKEGNEKKVLEIARESGRYLNNKDGLISYQLLKPDNIRQPIVFIANWKSKEHFEHAMASEDVKENHSGEKIKIAQSLMEKVTANNYNLVELFHS